MFRAELRVTTWSVKRLTGEGMYSASDTTKTGISHINVSPETLSSAPHGALGSRFRAGENLLLKFICLYIQDHSVPSDYTITPFWLIQTPQTAEVCRCINRERERDGWTEQTIVS